MFAALGTQWNVSYGGYVGLKYEAFPVVLDEFGIEIKARAEMFASLRIMENEALKVINKRS